MKMGTRLSLLLLGWFAAAVLLAGQPQATAPADAVRIERLAALGKVWGAVKYFHPFLGYREDIDWDAPLVAAVAKVRKANSAEEYADAVQGMLDMLGDRATKLLRKPFTRPGPAPAKKADRQPSYRKTDDGVLIVTLNDYTDLGDYMGAQERIKAIVKEIPSARAVLFDLRAMAPHPDMGGPLSYLFAPIAPLLCSQPYVTPGARSRMHIGFVPQSGTTSGGYRSGFFATDGQRIMPGPGAKDLPVVLLVNKDSEVPRAIVGLQAERKAAIVAEGGATDASLVATHTMPLTDGLQARIRVEEVVGTDGTLGVQPSVTVPVSQVAGDDNPAFQAALALARDFKIPATGPKAVAAAAATPTDKLYSLDPYPGVEYRLLAAFRIWTIANYFFPYKDLMGEDWDAVLKEFIPRMEQAEDGMAYFWAVSEMAAHLHDSHVSVSSPLVRERFGAPPPVVVRMIEGMPVITGLRDEEAAKAAGVEVGDVILKVDGEDAQARLAAFSKYQAASTPQSLMGNVANRFLLTGPDNTTAALTIRDRNERVKEVSLPRKLEYLKRRVTRPGEIFRVLPGNIGYADLERLTVPQVDAMFEKFKNTRAIIFDMRGYPNGTAWAIAPRLTEKDGIGGALFYRPVVMPPGGASSYVSQSVTHTFVQGIPPTNKWRYKGKTVMLIDERTISQAEHTGLFFEAANGTKFIGSPTAGANGDVTRFSVPGGIWLSFTGQSVRHADGRQLQRVGLVPDVRVSPTIKGIREGKDEVLEKALEYLARELGTQPQP